MRSLEIEAVPESHDPMTHIEIEKGDVSTLGDQPANPDSELYEANIFDPVISSMRTLLILQEQSPTDEQGGRYVIKPKAEEDPFEPLEIITGPTPERKDLLGRITLVALDSHNTYTFRDR